MVDRLLRILMIHLIMKVASTSTSLYFILSDITVHSEPGPASTVEDGSLRKKF